MRYLYLRRNSGSLSTRNQILVICNAQTLGIMESSENEKRFYLPRGEAAIQVQIDVNGKKYRSNAIFNLRNKDVKLAVTESGSNLRLSPIE